MTCLRNPLDHRSRLHGARRRYFIEALPTAAARAQALALIKQLYGSSGGQRSAT